MAKIFTRIDHTCEGCRCMGAEVLAPAPYHREPAPGEPDGAAVRLCYLCAHVVDAHAVEPRDTEGIMRAMEACKCPGDEVYPPDVLAKRQHGGLMAAARREITAAEQAAALRAADVKPWSAELNCWCGRPARERSGRCGHHDGSHRRTSPVPRR